MEKLGLHKDKAALARYWMPDEVIIEGIMRYAEIRETITGTQMQITTVPRKQAALEALAQGGFLN